MLEEVYSFANDGMNKALDSLKRDFGTIRSGKVSMSILDGIGVDYYGTPTPLNGVANLGTPDASTITITPWEKSMLKEIEKAILKSDLGLNPSNDGSIIRLVVPELTEETRKTLVKNARKTGEEAKVAIRSIRKTANDKIKALKKDSDLSEDQIKKAEDDIQKKTDAVVKEIDAIIAAKEKSVLSV